MDPPFVFVITPRPLMHLHDFSEALRPASLEHTDKS